MYAASVGKKQIGKTAAVIAGVAVLATIGILLARGSRGGEGGFAGETEEQREEFLLGYDLQVDQTSSVAKVMVPEEFDERFTKYNELLKATGFDLEPLRGETVTKCTYTVTNRPELGGVKAILLVSGGNIVGGHLLDSKTGELYALNHGLEPETTPGASPDASPDAQETLLPEPAEPAAAETDYSEIPAGAFPSE